MRHRIRGRNLSRTAAHLVALRRNMASSLFEHGKITTTLAKARHVQPFAEKLITLARAGTLQARRQVIARLQDRIMVAGHDPEEDRNVRVNSRGRVVAGPRAVRKLFDEIAPKYADRPGGYTRIIHLGKRRIGDGTELVVLQLVDPSEPARKKTTSVSVRRKRAKARYALAEKRSPRKADSSQPSPADEADAEKPSPPSGQGP